MEGTLRFSVEYKTATRYISIELGSCQKLQDLGEPPHSFHQMKIQLE
jgi:hypothetical protein